MWGFKNSLDRNLSNHLLKFILSKHLSFSYNIRNINKKGGDQEFLSRYVYPLIKSRSLIHDSFKCEKYEFSQPWPTKRLSDCYVGSPSNCNESNKKSFYECPLNCRPKDHKNWTYC